MPVFPASVLCFPILYIIQIHKVFLKSRFEFSYGRKLKLQYREIKLLFIVLNICGYMQLICLTELSRARLLKSYVMKNDQNVKIQYKNVHSLPSPAKLTIPHVSYHPENI
jgi:hypothetical protein